MYDEPSNTLCCSSQFSSLNFIFTDISMGVKPNMFEASIIKFRSHTCFIRIFV